MKSMIKKIKCYKERLSESKELEFLFLLGFGIFAFSRVFQYSLVIVLTNNIKSILRICAFALMFFKIVFQRYNRKSLIVSLMLYAFTILCIILGGDKNLILIPTVLVGMNNINIKKIVKILFIITVSSLIIHFIAFVISYIKENKEFISIFHYMWADYRNTLMFNNVNMFAFRYICALIQYLYLTNRNKSRNVKGLILFFISLFIFQITNCRTSFIISLMIVLFVFLEENAFFIQNVKLFKYVAIVFSLVSTIFITVIGYYQNIPVFYRINSLLANRPASISVICDYVGFNFFPSFEKFNNIKDYTREHWIKPIILPDNSYVSILLKWGILVTIILFILIYYFAYYKNHDTLTDYLIGVMSVMFVVEAIINEFVLYFVPLIIIYQYYKSYDS